LQVENGLLARLVFDTKQAKPGRLVFGNKFVARRSPRAAGALQKLASLVGKGAKWRITNFKQVAQAKSTQFWTKYVERFPSLPGIQMPNLCQTTAFTRENEVSPRIKSKSGLGPDC
jgi:hypothetical protein